jgi:transcriptional regulator with XRE-family HTH domain
MKKIFAERLKSYRGASGLSGVNLAAKVGVTQGTMSKYESPEYDLLPSFETLVRLAQALEVPLGVLAGLESPGPGTAPPKWVSDLLPDLWSLDRPGQEAVKALVRGLKR